ncbi:Nicotinamidase-related amidase [Variovorax sp. HW608]|uniref:cysteine hydrolase family protein n=1 Tax=Variovorax sp. HW608 TaxID=1034889 RepID=UPI0008201812|nr:cysteine hydrolase family protein [Variovorax sp. HW608]SCK27225.1 Nicotinamidase-related amidase [Variovorax sp. HW608]
MNTQLLIIDPQNDFMDIAGAALPVKGAAADMARLAGLIDQASPWIAQITVTLDSHHSIGIERPALWRQADGGPVAPFTQISAADVRAGKYAPRDPQALARVLSYLDALEAGGRYALMVWPVHCEIGTWGHNVEDEVRAAYNRWESATLRPVRKVFKGMNAWTENYSALQAEVPDPQDPDTQLNRELIRQLDEAERIVVAGEASSHCVRATVEHLAEHLPSGHLGKLVLLSDCMSPVPGFEKQAETFLGAMRMRGATVCTSREYMQAFCQKVAPTS